MRPANSVSDDLLPFYQEAGRIAAQALKHGATLIRPDVRVVEVLDAIEEHIRALGGVPAFPAQVSINVVAAHYCPEDGDETIFTAEDVVKLDVGVHVHGCVGDNAVTVDLSGKHADLVRAAREARDEAIKLVRPGVTPHMLGARIQEVITGYGFAPVKNLSGHGLGLFKIHTRPSIPNYANNDHTPLEEGMVIAIEPFATSGIGMITTGGNPTIFAQASKGRPRGQAARELLAVIEEYHGLPFTTRWLTRKVGEGKAKLGLRELRQLGMLVEYPPLPERSGGLVSQSEHTVLVKEKPVILTKEPE